MKTPEEKFEREIQFVFNLMLGFFFATLTASVTLANLVGLFSPGNILFYDRWSEPVFRSTLIYGILMILIVYIPIKFWRKREKIWLRLHYHFKARTFGVYAFLGIFLGMTPMLAYYVTLFLRDILHVI